MIDEVGEGGLALQFIFAEEKLKQKISGMVDRPSPNLKHSLI